MASKVEVVYLLRIFCVMTQTQFSKLVKRIRSDNGSEFVALKRYFDEQGILFETSYVAIPQQNGCVKRKHVIFSMLLALFAFKGNSH